MTTIVHNSIRELLTELAGRDFGLIAVDGWHGSGKSYFARAAGFCLGVLRFDLDRALSPRQNGFVEHLDLRKISRSIASTPRIILSGLCMREVLDRVGAPKAVHVYVQRMHHGQWTHEGEATGSEGDYRLLDRVCSPGALELEVRAYHAKWLPHENADMLLRRSVSKHTGL